MPIHVRYQGVDVTVRPTPLVNIATQISRTSSGKPFGVTYSITLSGTLLPDQGSPYAIDTQSGNIFPFHGGGSPSFAGPYNCFDNSVSHVDGGKPGKQQIPLDKVAAAILTKQRAIRGLFARDGQRIEITDYQEDRSAIVCYPRVIDISFAEGPWVHKCDFTITLEADTLLFGEGGDEYVDDESTLASDGIVKTGLIESDLLDVTSDFDGFISDYSDDWDVSIDLNVGEDDTAVTYKITHNISATGKNHWGPNGQQEPWQEARRFCRSRKATNGVYDYPNIDFPDSWVQGQPVTFSPGVIDLLAILTGYNYTINETINEPAGTYSISENWTVSPKSNDDDDDDQIAEEDFSTSTKISTGSPFVSVSIDGTIKGLSTDTINGIKKNSPLQANPVVDPDLKSKLENAMIKWHQVTNDAQFGLTCSIYRRANSVVAVELNSQPLSVTVGQNIFTGEISYSLEFDNRPTNFVTGTLTETISVNDTYPGDVHASIPVIGRKTGPVLQYIGGRTEYKRDLSISLTMDYTRLPYASGRNPFILKKPSIIEPTATDIASVVNQCSPANEPGIRKYFISPPTESWDAKSGSYSFNVSWTYEIDE